MTGTPAARRTYRKVTVIPPSLRKTARQMKREGLLPRGTVLCVVPRRFTWGPWCSLPIRDYDGSLIAGSQEGRLTAA